MTGKAYVSGATLLVLCIFLKLDTFPNHQLVPKLTQKTQNICIRLPLIIRQQIKAVKYWCKILKLSQSHSVRNAYNMLLELDDIILSYSKGGAQPAIMPGWMALASQIGVPVFALSSNEPGLIKFGNRRILGIQINSRLYLSNQLL